MNIFLPKTCWKLGVLFLIGGLFFGQKLQAQCSASAAFTVQQPDSCAQQAVTFTANDPNATSYSWSITGAGGASTGTGPSITRSFPALNVAYNMTVQLTVTGIDTAGAVCTVTSSQVVPVKATPLVVVIDNSFTPFDGCTIDSTVTSYTATYTVQLPATGPYTWNFGDGSAPITSPANSQTHTYNGYGNYFLTVSASNGTCTGRFEQPIYFQLPPIANMNLVGGFNICEDQTIQVENNTDTTNRKVDRYIWDWGNGDRDTVFDKNAIFYVYSYTDEAVCDSQLNLQGKFTEEVRLIVQNGCGEHYNASPVYVDPLPRAEINGPDLGCENSLLTFTNESCPDVNVLYTWDFGDGSPQIGPLNTKLSMSHAFANPGTYDVMLIACKPACNACDTAIQTVTILEPPTALFDAIPDTGCAPLVVDVVNQSSPTFAASYTWTVLPNNGVSYLDSTDNNSFQPRFQFADSGVFIIRLRVDNICGFDTDEDTILVASPPEVTLAPVPDTCGFLDYVPVVSYNDNGNPISSYTWTFSNATPATSNLPFPTGPFTFLPDTQHTVTITVENLCGPTSASITFAVDTPLSVIDAGADFSLCLNEDTTLTGFPIGVGSWSGSSFIDPNGLFEPQVAGTYELIYSSGTGACRVADTIIVVVNPFPTVDILTADQEVCVGDSSISILTNLSGGIWNFPLDSGDVFTPLSPLDTMLVYTFTDSLGCANADSINIRVRELPTVTTTDTTFCQGNGVQTLQGFSPTSAGTVNWVGYGIQNSSLPNYVPDSIGTFPVVYTFTDPFGCTAADTMLVTVVAGSPPDAGPDTSLCRNEQFVVLNQANPTTGTWSVGAIVLPNDTVFFAGLPGGPNEVIYTTGAGSCLSRDTLFVDIRDTLQINAGPDTLICEDAPLLSFAPNPAQAYWTDGLGFVSLATGQYQPGNITPGTTDTLRLEGDLNGCISRDVRLVTVDSLPVIDFGVPDTACVLVSVNFLDSTSYVNTYAWDFGDGNNSALPNPVHAYQNSGDYIITLTGTNPNGCQDFLTKDIHITEAPLVDFGKSANSGCAPLTLNFNDLSLPRGGSYTWIMGNGDTLYGPNPGPITYQQGTDDTTYYIRLIIQNSCSTVEKIDSVVVFPQPQVVVGTDFSEGCSPLLISFANLTVGNPDNFSWDLGQGGALVTDSIPAPRYYVTDSLDSVYTIYLTATNSCGSDIDSVDILVHPNNLDPIFNTSNTQGCMPFTVQFTNLSGASIVSWDYGDNSGNADVGIMAPNHTFTDSGTYLVRMFVDNGCSKDTGEVLITVHPQEPAVFVASDPVCLGDTLSFQPTGGGNVNGYLWHFGDGDSSTATLAQHVYQAPGTYQVSLTSFSQSFQCPNQWDTVVTVYALPPASLNLDTTAGCQPLSLQLSNGPTGLTYWYDFGNGDTSTVLNPAYTYADSGDFVLQLTTQDGNGCRADTAVNIRVHPLPMSDFVPDQDSLCGPGPVAFTQGSTLATRYHWDFGTGNAADTSALLNPIFPYQNPGSYQVSLTNTTVFGCQDSVEKRVVVLPASQAALQADTVQGCQPLTVSFSHQASGFGRLRWDFGDGSAGFVGPSPPPHTFFGGDTTYTVRLLADTAGLCLDSASLEIRLATPPRAAFLPDDHQACGSDTVLFTNQSTSAVLPLSYVWDFGAPGQSFQANPPAVVFPQADIYPVSLIATNSFGCADTAAEVVRIHPEPEADFALSDSLICPSTLIQFTNLSSNYSGARWEFGDGAFSFADSPDHVYGLQDTEVMVSLVVDTAGFCFDSVEKRLQIASFPVADFSFSPDSFCGAADVNFVNLSTTLARPISYQWTFGNGLSSNVADPQTAYTVDDTLIQFPVRLITTNTFGCADTANQWVTGFPQPLAAFQPLPDSGCSELVVNFVNLSENYTHSLWNFGNGLFSDDAFPTTIYPTGVFDVELVVSYENVCFDRLRVEDQIVVKQSAIAAFTFDNASFQPRDGTVIFSNQSQFADRFRWFFGDGVSSPEINPTHRYMVNDTFMVSLIANNAWNCPDTAILPVRPWPFGDVQIPNAFKPGSGLDSTDVFLPVAVGLVEWEIGVYDIYGNRVWHSTALGAVGSPLEGRPIESWDGTIHTNSRINSGGPVKTPDVFTWKIHKAVFKGGRRFEGRREGTVTVLR